MDCNLDEATRDDAGEGWWVWKNLRRQKEADSSSGIWGIKKQMVFVLKCQPLKARGGTLRSKFRQCNEKGQIRRLLAKGVEEGCKALLSDASTTVRCAEGEGNGGVVEGVDGGGWLGLGGAWRWQCARCCHGKGRVC